MNKIFIVRFIGEKEACQIPYKSIIEEESRDDILALLTPNDEVYYINLNNAVIWKFDKEETKNEV